MQPTTNTELQNRIDNNLQKLRTLRDEVKVRAHLFSMDMLDQWKKLEPKVVQAELAAKKATEASAAALGGAIEALIQFQGKIKE
jgi:hypothetical protein